MRARRTEIGSTFADAAASAACEFHRLSPNAKGEVGEARTVLREPTHAKDEIEAGRLLRTATVMAQSPLER